MEDIILRHYTPRDADAFRILNEAWIQSSFTLEEPDRKVLNDPQGGILDKGGAILIAEYAGRVVGTCALIAEEHVPRRTFEIGKMTVAAEMQGQGIGRRILAYTIETARELGAERLYLESNNKLTNAIHLYEAVGFRHLPPESVVRSPYSRSNVHMELLLPKL